MADGNASPTTFIPTADNARLFRRALGTFTTGVTIVTCRTEAGPLGITANSFSSLSLDPPLVLWSPARSSGRFQAFHDAPHFAIHVLADTQAALCDGFARAGDIFDGVDWAADDTGVPLMEGCLARFVCTRHAVHDGGDHAIVVGHVRAVTIGAGAPLVFARGQIARLAD